MIVNVTKKHINNGERNNCYKCPIALAVTDTANCRSVVVDEVTMSFFEDDNERRTFHNLPRSAKRFIKKYDEDEAVKPFKFILSERTKCR